MDERIRQLERSVRSLRLGAALLASVLVFTVFAAFRPASDDDQVLRARGLVIVDEEGRERILLGAPIPAAAHRVRTDLERVAEIWAPTFPPKYMEYYKEYRHDMNGLLVLDENGFDKVAIGASLPDLAFGKRIAPINGMIVNDDRGFERTGYGVLKVNDNTRVVLGLDSAAGSEGLTLHLFDEGEVGVRIRKGQRSIFLGDSVFFNDQLGVDNDEEDKGFLGLLLMEGNEVTKEISAADGE